MEALKKQIKEIYCETINNGKCVYNIKQKNTSVTNGKGFS